MHENHLFEYAVIRIVPRVEREEFLNAGVIVYCAKHKYLQVKFTIDPVRLNCFCKELDVVQIHENLRAFERICVGGIASGPIGKFDMASRFRWLTATRSTVVQSSKVHPGFCIDPATTLVDLYKQLVL